MKTFSQAKFIFHKALYNFRKIIDWDQICKLVNKFRELASTYLFTARHNFWLKGTWGPWPLHNYLWQLQWPFVLCFFAKLYQQIMFSFWQHCPTTCITVTLLRLLWQSQWLVNIVAMLHTQLCNTRLTVIIVKLKSKMPTTVRVAARCTTPEGNAETQNSVKLPHHSRVSMTRTWRTSK